MNWDLYSKSLKVEGETRRDRVIYQTQRIMNSRVPNSPAYKNVLIDGEPQDVVITSSTEMYSKKINAMPGERIYMGSIVEWNGRHFIINATDVEDEVYQRGTMYQCNVYLKWQNEKGEIVARYGFCEDLSQFAAGVVESKIMNSIEQNYTITFPVDEETVKLRRDRRFLMDVITDEPDAYILTNRKVILNDFSVTDISETDFDGKDKLLLLTFSQTQRSEKDNFELMIADYFDPTTVGEQTSAGTSCSIKYSGEPKIKVGGNGKSFTAEFYDSDGNVIDVTPSWEVITMPEFEGKFIVDYNDNKVKIKA